eukprot:Opistho-1_new@81521
MNNRSAPHDVAEHVTRVPKKMDVNINTLTGDGFSLRVSPYETVMSVKAKIQKQEGIPISQQHLVWRSVALEDDYTLNDYSITDGATLQLVLHLRGGPINTRRITYEDTVLREVAELVDGREDLLKKLFEGKDRNRPVTLLVYRDGDRLSLIEVVHRDDGTITPLDRDRSPTPPHADPVEEAASLAEQMRENAALRLKMKKVQASLHKHKQDKQKKIESEGASPAAVAAAVAVVDPAEPVDPTAETSPPTSQPGTATASVASLIDGALTASSSKSSSTSSFGGLKKGFLSGQGKPKPKSDPSVPTTAAALDAVDSPARPPPRHHDVLTPAIPSAARSAAAATAAVGVGGAAGFADHIHREHHALLSGSPGADASFGALVEPRVRRVGSAGTNANRALVQERGAPFGRAHQSVASLMSRPAADEEVRMHKSRRETMSARPARRNEVVSIDSLRRTRGGATKAKAASSAATVAVSTQASADAAALPRPKSARKSDGAALPPITAGQRAAVAAATEGATVAIAGEAKSPGGEGFGPNRCHSCGKKLGLASNYPCRCGLSYCAKHRHAELHNCTYDYKSVGRRALEENNPVVTAPKLPKI